ncbi:MAG: LPS export ABC transporter permease LptF [Rhodocyclaceae bacterium]|jgi:lipopolysaccharide export system permease protein|nr:LPS export ABC transporter permease LptF [Rhodocyclaceae bacterium]
MIFQRTTRREFANTAAAIFVGLFAILITVVLIRLLAQAAGGRLPSESVLALIGFGAVAQLPIVLTLTVFIAVLLSLSRSYRDSEMVVWFASGVPLTAWIRPVLRFALPAVGVIAAVTLFLAPWAQLKSSEYKERVNNQDDAARVAPGVFRESSNAQRVFFVEVAAGEDGRVRNVFVNSVQDGRLGVMVAREGFLRTEPNGDRFVVLENGRRYEGVPGAADYRVMEFERYAVRLDSKGSVELPHLPRTLSLQALLEDPSPANRGELLYRVGIPVAALVLALLAIPLSFINPRAGRAHNLVLALLTYLIYTNAISVAQAWVARGKVAFEMALWVPHLAMVVVLMALFYRRLAVFRFWRRRA